MAEQDYTQRLEGYVEVAERIDAFHEKHPEGSLQGDYTVRELNGQTLIVYKARAYRTPDDTRPGIGFASEPVPGSTPYTRDSELMNAETSAWGRALVAIGFKGHRGVASANEVRARENGQERAQKGGFASDAQRNLFERVAKGAGLKDDTLASVLVFASETMSGRRDGGISKAIDGLKDKETRSQTAAKLVAEAQKWHESQSDLPIDDADLPPLDESDRAALAADPGPES